MDHSIYKLAPGVRILSGSDTEIRFRKGIWNYTEATLSLVDQSVEARGFFRSAVAELLNKGTIDVAAFSQEEGAGADGLDYSAIFDRLVEQGFVYPERQSKIQSLIIELLGGERTGFQDFISEARPVLYISDSISGNESADLISRNSGIPIDKLGDETFRKLSEIDLTDKTDAVRYANQLEDLRHQFEFYACVLVCFTRPRLTVLRNLNRLSIELRKPIVIGLMDGPFASLLACIPPETGCFECYEHRLLARLEDTTLYNDYVKNAATGAQSPFASESLFAHLITAAGLAEAAQLSTLQMARASGRSINVYLPLLEFHAEDLLRVPYCPACGFVSKMQMKGIYSSAQQIVEQMLDCVAVENPSTSRPSPEAAT
ncbi:hypothetical protein [Rhizobium leguminosarum]|uniref:hypothetical protein n=1 Tax=Rhizobium leguminosarum TaxID=384 RepID=UPI0012F9FA92|nr:hypothetical protein [Rhizobium leguminosarum]